MKDLKSPSEQAEPKRQSHATIDWPSLISLWESSGMSQKKFCEQKSLGYAEFVYKRSQLARQRNAKPAQWLSVKKTTEHFPIMPVSAGPTLGSFVLRLPNGQQLSIPANADPQTLKTLLTFMEKSAC